jgi:hypothetical protein
MNSWLFNADCKLGKSFKLTSRVMLINDFRGSTNISPPAFAEASLCETLRVEQRLRAGTTLIG